MVKKTHKMVLDGRRVKVHELVTTVDISKTVVYHILTVILDMRKLCTRCVSCLLTMEQRTS